MEEQKILQRVQDRPDIRYLNSHVRSHICSACDLSPGIWKDLGIELMGQDSVTDVNTISANNRGDVVGCCSSLFTVWLQRQPEASWKQLIDALIKIKLNMLASEIQKSLIPEQQQNSQQGLVKDALRVTETNVDINVSSSADDTTQNGRTAAMTSNADSEVPSTEQDILRAFETDGSVNLSTSVGGITQNSRTSAMTSNAESEVPSTDQDAAFKYFVEPLNISDAYLRMIAELNSILKHCDLSDLQSVLIHQVNTPKGIQLKEVLKEKIRNKIEAATSSFYLISILADFPFCNWLDTRLVEALAIGSRLKSSSDLVNAYKKFLFQKKFRDALLEFPTVQEEEIEAYVIAVSEKIHVDPDKITIGDFLKKRRTMEHAILDLMNQTLCIQNVRKGCVEFSYYIQENCSLRAYKMALHNRYKFYTVNLIHIKIEEHPVIYDPWLPDFDKEIAKQSLYAQYEVVTEMYHILLDNIPMDDIGKMFSSHSIFTNNDLEVISFTPSEYLKRQFVLQILQCLKLSVWILICNVLENNKFMSSIGSQLRHVLKDKLSYTEFQMHALGNIQRETCSYNRSTLHGTRTIKLGFVDDSTLFNKSHDYHSRTSLSLFAYSFHHVKCIKPSKVEKEFHYISGHVIELLSCCEPKLLIKWCENFMASEIHKIKLFPSYSLYKLRKLKDSSSIFKMMSVHWTWNNHSVLTCLANFSEMALTMLEEFDSRLRLKFGITKYPLLPPTATMIPYINNSYTILTLKCNEKLHLSLQLVHEMQSVLIEKCEITEHALQLLAVQGSPLLLQWMISKYIVTIFNVNVRQHCQYFSTKGIIEISIHPNIKHNIDSHVRRAGITAPYKKYTLHSSTVVGNVTEVEKIIQSGVYADSTLSEKTPLYVASREGHNKVVEVLIKAGADVNFVIKDSDRTPLHEAASHQRNEQVVEILVKAGADVNAVDKLDRTPLHEAASHQRNEQVVEILLKAGADVNFVDKSDITPLHEAASQQGNKQVIEILLKAGANVNFVDKSDRTPLHEAASHQRNEQVVEILLKAGADVNSVDKSGRSPLHEAASHHRNEQVVEILVKAGTDVNSVDKVSYFQKTIS